MVNEVCLRTLDLDRPAGRLRIALERPPVDIRDDVAKVIDP